MCTPYGPVCDHCGQPVFLTYHHFFFTHESFCSPTCLEAKEQEHLRKARSKSFTLHRGWIDCAGKCRTWRVKGGNGEHIAEVTHKRDGQHLISLLSGNGRKKRDAPAG